MGWCVWDQLRINNSAHGHCYEDTANTNSFFTALIHLNDETFSDALSLDYIHPISTGNIPGSKTHSRDSAKFDKRLREPLNF